MSLFLIAPDLDLTLEVPIPPDSLDAISRYLAAVKDGWEHENFCKRLSEEIGRVLPDVIDWKLKPPTKAQMAFARSLCRQLDIPLPTDAATMRGAMHRFIELNSLRLRD
ncbi:hypothetical protein [Pseudoxanthomonas sp. UTMC 1351]|uniref:hypothetical protein n=1 Tax=Pseudoxanthomonas sp. UTMC 1351 TaxID=2695853 RepID=UPI0034CF7D48